MLSDKDRSPILASLTRRRFLQSSAAAAALGVLPRFASHARGGTFPLFSLGVASGDPTSRSVVLWTRLAPDPLQGGGMGPDDVSVEWEVFGDEALTRLVRRGRAKAGADDAHTVHVTVGRLKPDSWYWYRFRALGEESRVGRTRTMPRGSADRLRFALCSCQDYQNGHWAAYRDLAAQDLDLVVHVGDYIYEYAANAGAIRSHLGGETQTLDDYRNRHALYRLDPFLQDAHARFPFILTWDDHEVQNNYAGDDSENPALPPELFLERRAQAYQAYYEHLPLRAASRPRRGGGLNLYRTVSFGKLASFFVLDGRQFRTPVPCGGGLVVPECPDVFDPDATFLGTRQERWLYRGLKRSRAQWNVLAQQVMMLRGDLGEALGSPTPIYNPDAWDGYQAQRTRILNFLHRERIANPIVLTGDIHSAWVADLKLDFLDFASPTVASEFVCTSISSDFPAGFLPLIENLIGSTIRNRHIYFFEGRHRGYTLCEVTPEAWRSDFRIVDVLADPSSAVTTAASWIVDAGTPGAHPA
jgi:alkaline phosphatase D